MIVRPSLACALWGIVADERKPVDFASVVCFR